MSVELEVVEGRLQTITDEMQLTLLRSAYSGIIKEGWDASAALFLPNGETLSQATAIPVHLGTLIPAVERLIAAFPPEEMREGDAYALNDPYDGGTHLPDIVIVTPILVGEVVVALSATIAHHQDVGGNTPGSTPTNARELFQEGLVLPPVRLVTEGKPNEPIWEILRRNTRIPDVLVGDIRAQLAACHVGTRRYRALVEQYGAERLKAINARLLDRGEQVMRSCIRSLPDGVYDFTDWLDNDGVELDHKLQIAVQIHIHGDSVTVTFDGTSFEAKGPVNSVPSSTLSAVLYAFRALAGPHAPNNGGCYRPIEMRLPSRSLVNPRRPAPVNARTATLKRLADALFGALAKAAPDRIPAASSGTLLIITFGGFDPRRDSYFVIMENVDGGSGGGALLPGVSAISTDVTNSMNTPVEVLELTTPLRINHYRLRDGSGGAGFHEGGLGVEKEYEVIAGEVTVSHRGERFYSAPWGVLGGESGATSYGRILFKDGHSQDIPSKAVATLKPGDRLQVGTPGGGGYGAVGGKLASGE